VTLRLEMRGRVEQRELGPRDVLTVTEAAAILKRPVNEIRKDIRARFLRTTRRKGRVMVTVAACRQFLDEEREDGKAALDAAERIRRGEARLIPYEEVKKRLGWR
jgi:predicted DNA-binding protein